MWPPRGHITGRALIWGTAGGYVADTIYREVTGRSSSPYEPGALLVDNLNLGGLMNEGPEVLRGFTKDAYYAAVHNDRYALKRATDSLLTMKTYFLPFADAAVGATEAVSGTENLDRYAVNQLRAALDERYKARPFGSYRVERTPMETVQTFLFATRTGKKVKKRANSGDAEVAENTDR